MNIEIEFDCGCGIHADDLAEPISVWVHRHAPGCPNYALIALELERCLRQLRIQMMGLGGGLRTAGSPR